jgi:hypothetical protein
MHEGQMSSVIFTKHMEVIFLLVREAAATLSAARASKAASVEG